ncbi:MAG: dTDP-4-dehydrorhamnose reductase [Rikenellaceae bacterium]|nr:dTDP-4-dehydrorhamnose reductase [Rikenellaceae bacterium]
MEKSSIEGRILVTGSAGQLGKSLRKIAGQYPDLDLFFPDESDADLTDREQIERHITASNIGGIINCAAYTAVDRAEEDEETAYTINTLGVRVLGDLCKTYGIPLIHFSTDYVFDGLSDDPYTEVSAANPLGAYGRTKLAGERALCDWGCNAVVIRTSWLYSEFGNNFVVTMLRLGGEGKPLRVVCDQRGTPTYATDLARAALEVLRKGVSGFDILHYSALGQTSWYGFAREIFLLRGIQADITPVSTEQYPVKAPRPRNSVMCMDKALQRGLTLRPWQDALAECLGEIE